MNTSDFKNQFDLDRTGRGLKASPKAIAPTEAPVSIADGSSYRDGETHFFFDRNAGVIRSTQGLKRIDGEFLGSVGLKVVAIGQLHTRFADAVDFAQKSLLDDIEGLRDRICELENSKPKNERSMKRILMARGL